MSIFNIMGISKEQILKQKSQLSPAKQKLLERSLQGTFKSESELKPISRRSSTVPSTLSFAQQRLWFLQQLEPDNSFYNEYGAIQLSGMLHVAALERTLNRIIQRHEVLRTTFNLVEEKPVQVIASNLTLALPVIDLRQLAEAQRQQEIQRLSIEQSQSPFDLVNGPLLRWMLLQISDREHVLLFNIHHTVFDGWSEGLLVRELSALYQEFTTGKPASLPELPIQYADFAVWQRQHLQGEKLESQLSYWKQQLENAPPLLQLPTDRPRPPVQTYRGAKLSFQLSKNLTQGIQAIAQKNEATLFMTLLAVFKILLYRYTGQEDIVVGSYIANRNRAEIEDLIGFFVNTLVLRTKFSGNPTFEELLCQVRKMMIGAYAHQDLPFEKLVEELQVERDPKYNPIFQVSFGLQNTPEVKLELPELTVTLFEVEHTKALFDLRLDLTQTDSGLEGFWEYNTDLFDSSTIERMSQHFQILLEAIVNHPQQRISELPLLSQAEQQQLLVGWNETQVNYPKDKCIHQLFEEQVEKTPDALALVFEEQQLTYRQLNAKANQLAHYLQHLGVKPEVLVGICVERSVEMVVGLLGILKAGGAYLPLDPHYPSERLAKILADSQVSLIITQEELMEKLPATTAPIIYLEQDFIQESQANPISELQSHNLAYIIYTSGSTGKPKGVEIEHRSAVNLLNSIAKQPGLTEKDTVLAVTTICFDVAVPEIFLPLAVGAKVVVASSAVAADGRELLKILNKSQVTFMHPTPVTWRLLLAAGWRGSKNLKMVSTGESLPKELVAQLLPKGAELWNLYGPTEITVWATGYKIEAENQPILIGRPIDNTQAYILDAHQKPVPIGVSGELYIGGAGIARGYLNRPELTAEKFIWHEKLNIRLYKTGDLARYLSDGNIECLGRIDHQVKIRGFRIELGEIEAVLSSYPQIQQAVVIAREDIPGNQSLVAYIVTRQESLSTNQLREFLSLKLPEYMVPNLFIPLDTLPLTPNGKVDRKALPTPEGKIALEQEYVAPRTPNEEMLAKIFSSVLGVSKVGIYDNFFELGGHSLLATQLISRLRVALEIEIPLRTIFESSTVAQLEPKIKQLRATESGLNLPPIRPRREGEQLPLSWAQERLWFLARLEESTSTYNISGAIRLSGQLKLNALQRALSEIVRRHQVLRTSFSTVNERPIQLVDPEATLKIKVVDLQQLEPTERETELEQQVQQEASIPFNLERSPLLRCSLLQLDTRESVLLLTMHHIVSDGWSIGIFIQELSSLYSAFCAGESSPLPELPIQYGDFALWQRQWLSGEVLTTQLDYWQQQLKGAPELLQLPTDRPRPNVQTYRGATQSFYLNAQLSQKLEALSRESGSTLFMTLLAGFATLLYRYSGQTDIVIGSPIANRNRSEMESLIGCFVNTLVLRSNLADNPRIQELLAQVRETTLKAYEHQDLPFEKLVEVLQPQRSLSHSPLFQVMFILQNAPMQEMELSGVTWTQLEQKSTIAKFDLTLSVTETEAGLEGLWEYNTDLFDGSTIERMNRHFQILLEAMVNNPQQQISELPLLTQPERQQLLVEWNDTQVDYPQDQCIHQLFEEQVEKTPDAVAVVFEEQQLTYRQLNAKANQLAHYLQQLGVKPEVLVGICIERSLEMVVGLLGILKTGGAYVPLDPYYPQERLAYMLKDAQIPVLLTQQPLLNQLPEHQAKVVCLDTDWSLIEPSSLNNLEIEVSPKNLAYAIYTSGSTGKPKGVQIPQRALINFLNSMQLTLGMKEPDLLLSVTTLSFDIAALEVFLPLISGSGLVLISRDVAMDGSQLLERLSTSNATFMQATPATWRLLLAAGWQGEQPLKVLCGGEALDNSLAADLVERSTQVWNLYGPTESTIWSAVYQVESQLKTSSKEGTIPIGRPIGNTQIYLLDHHLQPVPIGVTGELHIGGDGLARGYLNRSELTQEKFIPNPIAPSRSSKLYKTGDLARYLSDGKIEYLGRIDNQVKVRGFRIELGEIEAAIAQHPAVRESVVITSEESTESNDFKRLVAYVVAREEATVTISALRNFVASKLPRYMIPSAWVTLDSLPLTPNNKVDRKALPVPEKTRPELDKKLVAPRNFIESELTKIWTEVLDVDKVGIFDNFFELGGDSILAIVAITRANQASKLQVTVKQLFQHQTVAELAMVVVPQKIEQTKPKTNSKDKLSSFPKANLNQQDLDRFLAKVKNGSRNQTI